MIFTKGELGRPNSHEYGQRSGVNHLHNLLTMSKRYQIQRGDKKVESIEELFFPVDIRPLYWLYQGREPVKTTYSILVDEEYKETFTAVSSSYGFIHNEEAYFLGREIASRVFESSEQFKAIGDYLCRKGASCYMRIYRPIEKDQPLINEGWRAFLRITNSYNKTYPLSYTFGFHAEKDYDIVLPSFSIELKTPHTERPDEKIREQLRDWYHSPEFFTIKQIEREFIRIIDSLKKIVVAERDFLPFFCKVFRISKRDNLGLLTKGFLIQSRDFLKERIPVFIKQYGQNGYALLHVLAAYSSTYSRNFISTPNHSSVYEQNRLGKWVKSFIEDAKDPNFSIYEYLGKDPCDSASWLESM